MGEASATCKHACAGQNSRGSAGGQARGAHLGVEADDVRLRHLRWPDGGGEHECMRRTRVCGVGTQLLRFTRRLTACPCDYHDAVESVFV